MAHDRPWDRGDAGREDEDGDGFGFLDIIAFVLAAYQLILPMLLGIVGVIVLLYLIFRFVAS